MRVIIRECGKDVFKGQELQRKRSALARYLCDFSSILGIEAGGFTFSENWKYPSDLISPDNCVEDA